MKGQKHEGTALNMETRKYRLTGLTPILGSQPANDTLRTDYIASKAPEESLAAEEKELFAADTFNTQGLTVFARDPDARDRIILLDYMVRGFFKSALLALQSQLNIKQPKTKVDRYLFVEPRRIPIIRDGSPVYDEDSEYERTIRVETMRVPRVTLASSECLETPWAITINVTLLPNSASKSSNALTFSDVEAALDYGRFSGLGQFRNGSYGRFEWERLDG